MLTDDERLPSRAFALAPAIHATVMIALSYRGAVFFENIWLTYPAPFLISQSHRFCLLFYAAQILFSLSVFAGAQFLRWALVLHSFCELLLCAAFLLRSVAIVFFEVDHQRSQFSYDFVEPFLLWAIWLWHEMYFATTATALAWARRRPRSSAITT